MRETLTRDGACGSQKEAPRSHRKDRGARLRVSRASDDEGYFAFASAESIAL
ncbi:MAG: hypothetical protein NVSMB47_18310 [Polyangiales bacterium]